MEILLRFIKNNIDVITASTTTIISTTTITATLLNDWWKLVLYVIIEICFYLLYCYYMIPRANERTKSLSFIQNDYKSISKRHHMIVRVIQRIQDFAIYEVEKEQVEKESKNRSVNSNKYPLNNDHRQQSYQIILQKLTIEFFSGWFHSLDHIPQLAPGIPTLSSSQRIHQRHNEHEEKTTNEEEIILLRNNDSIIKEVAVNDGTSTNNNGNDDDLWLQNLLLYSSSIPSLHTSSATNSGRPSLPKTLNRASTSVTTYTSDGSSSNSDDENSDGVIVLNDDIHFDNVCCNIEVDKDINGNIIVTTPATSSTTKEINTNNTTWNLPNITKRQMNEFLSWGLFAKPYNEMSIEEMNTLPTFYHLFHERLLLVFNDNEEDNNTNSSSRVPRRLNLENVNPLHRPLLFYIIIALTKFIGSIILRMFGFQRVISIDTGLKGWYRPCKNNKKMNNIIKPILFFHGIGPSGVTLYIPMIVNILCNQWNHHPVFLFENPNIATTLFSYDALNEVDTCTGVYEIMNKCLYNNTNSIGSQQQNQQQNKWKLTIIGHSFGSCQVTWMIHSSLFYNCIDTVILLDPVSIMLSDPDVMCNFLYNTTGGSGIVRMFASSELYTEHYLRRHFAWYNSELWMEYDILNKNTTYHPNVHIMIGLAEEDAIVNSPKVKTHIDLTVQKYKQQQQQDNNNKVKMLYWENSDHADCVKEPKKWSMIRQYIDRRFVVNDDEDTMLSYKVKKEL